MFTQQVGEISDDCGDVGLIFGAESDSGSLISGLWGSSLVRLFVVGLCYCFQHKAHTDDSRYEEA